MRCKTLVCAVLAVTAAVCSQAQSIPPQSHFSGNAGYQRLPLTFEVNHGQSAPQVKFISRGPGYRAYLTADGVTLSLRSSDRSDTKQKSLLYSPERSVVQFHLVGAASNPQIVGEGIQPGRMNYFIGNDPSKWQRNVPTYAQIRYKNVYPGIDLVFYGNNQQLEYDFAVAANADPRQIQFQISGASRIQIAADGSLALQIGTGEVHFQVPVVYQESQGRRIPVNGAYSLIDSSHIQFHLAAYDTRKPLVIDPVLIYSTYLGGSGTEQPSGIAVDASGNVYVAGATDSTDFPLGTIGNLPVGSAHAYVAKLDPTGSHLIYADYLGGSSQDYGFALALDASNNVYVTGSTASSDFPMVNPFQGSYPGAFNAFLSKISSDGASLLYSTYFGGNGSDLPSGVAVDQLGNTILAGYTSSTNLPLNNAFQSSVSPNQGGVYGSYGFLTKFSPDGSSLVYSTYFGGSSNVQLNCGGTPCWTQPSSTIASLALDPSGNAYIAGSTNTYNFPVTQGAYLTTNSTPMNSNIGFVSKFSSAGSLQYSTYFYGTSGLQTNIAGIAVDGTGSAYVTGAAFSDGTFPVTSTSICDPGTQGWGCSYAFVTKFDNAGATLLYSTFLGPNNGAIPAAIALDSSNDAYVLAFTSSNNFSAVNGIEPYSNGNDILLAEIDPSGTSQLFATYLGGSGDDEPALGGLAVDADGNVYIAGVTNSIDLPVTPTAFQSNSAGNADSFLMKLGPASAPAVTLRPTSLQFALRTVGTTSTSQNVLLQNMGSAPLTISAIAANGDFSETNNCSTSVAAAGNCTISVTFAPTAAGTRTGSVSIQDDAAGSPHVIVLTGSGTGPAVSLNPQTLTFSGIPTGSTSAAQSVTVTNSGDQLLTISGISVSGAYSQNNNCPGSLGAGSNCTINVSFTPTKTGANSGTLTVTDNAFGGTQTVSLNGTGSDFNITASLTSATVKAGGTATYSLTVGAVGGTFPNAVSLSCSGAPQYSTCSLSQSPVTPGSSSATVTLSVKTTGKSAQLAQSRRNAGPFVAVMMQLQGFGVFGLLFVGSKQGRKPMFRLLILALLVGGLLFLVGCAGGTGIATQSTNSTPAGTYTLTVTGTSGALQHSLPVSLTVQ